MVVLAEPSFAANASIAASTPSDSPRAPFTRIENARVEPSAAGTIPDSAATRRRWPVFARIWIAPSCMRSSSVPSLPPIGSADTNSAPDSKRSAALRITATSVAGEMRFRGERPEPSAMISAGSAIPFASR